MREWIETNGLGGYASLTYSQANTRKYHGLLVAALNPPTNRWVFVSNILDSFRSNSRLYPLSETKNHFFYGNLPVFKYNANGVSIEKTVLMPYERNITVLRYVVSSKTPIEMIHHPLVNSRHIYDVMKYRSLRLHPEIGHEYIRLHPQNIDKVITISVPGSEYYHDFWWEELFYTKDFERNDSCVDNVMHLGDFHVKINGMKEYYVILGLEHDFLQQPEMIYSQELERKKKLLTTADLSSSFDKLVLAADRFVVTKNSAKSIIAGYHWFSDWGRDTLIALPGITLVTKRFDVAQQILSSLSTHCHHGLIPNVFMDRDSQPAYNTVDASLWFIDRVYQYLKYTNDQTFLKKIWSTLTSIITAYIQGTDFAIHMDPDFLIAHGEGLTWMDVRIGDYYPTPRSKKAVEIQALWYNALKIMSTLSGFIGVDDIYADYADKVRHSFLEQYDKDYDVLDTKDGALRPNKVFLVSLDYSMIHKKRQQAIVQDIQKHLLTIFGLRTLAADNPFYKGEYLGPYNKDLAYHNGTVWPWLLGPFIRAYVKTHDDTQAARTHAFEQFLQPMVDVYGDSWDGSIHEIFDGNPPFLPQGCISQAWSVGEILRTWVEDINNIRPLYEKEYCST